MKAIRNIIFPTLYILIIVGIIFGISRTALLQGTPPTFVGTYLNISRVTLEGHYNPDSNKVFSNFAEMAPRNVDDSLVYAWSPVPGLKWDGFTGIDIVGPNINVNVIDDWVLVSLVNAEREFFKAGLLTMGGKIVDSYSGKLLHMSVIPGFYYIKIYHRTHVSILSSNMIFVAGGEDMHSWSFDRPENVYGINPLKKLSNGRFVMYTGDAVRIDFVGLLSFISINNHLGVTNEYTNDDQDNTGTVVEKDLQLNWDNWYVQCQSPYSRKKYIDPIGPDNILWTNFFKTTVVPYQLTAKNFVKSSGTAGDVLKFDIELSGNFIFGGVEFQIKFDTTYLNGRPGHVTMLNTFTSMHNVWIDRDKIKGWIIPSPGQEDSISSDGTLLCQIQLTTEARLFNGTNNGMQWINPYTNVAMKKNGQFILITDTNNHFFYNGLVGINPSNTEQVESYSLSQNYPNPFNPSTTIRYSLPNEGFVSLRIFDIIGREVDILVNEKQSSGEYTLSFNGSKLSSGTYFYKLTIDDFTSVKKMVLSK